MTKTNSVLPWCFFFLGLLAFFGQAEPSLAEGAVASPAATASDATVLESIRHVIVIVQENRSFDNVFHGFPGADTVGSGRKARRHDDQAAPGQLHLPR